MAVKITPIIATAQNVYDYCGISAGTAAANIASGITLASLITSLLARSAQMICSEINYDYTAGQVVWLRDFGNDQQYITTPWPIATITTFTSWDPGNPATAVVVIGAGALSVATNDPYTVFRNDGLCFSSQLKYYIEFTQAVNPDTNGWPSAIVEIQCEMVATIYKESQNDESMLSDYERESSIGRPIRYDKNVWERFKKALRPFKICPE